MTLRHEYGNDCIFIILRRQKIKKHVSIPASIALSTALAISSGLAGCGKREDADWESAPSQTKSELRHYRSPEECVKANIYSPDFCKKSWDEAIADHGKNAPKFSSLADCERDFRRCETHRSSESGSSWFLPYMMGYTIANMNNNAALAAATATTAYPTSNFRSQASYNFRGATTTTTGHVIPATGVATVPAHTLSPSPATVTGVAPTNAGQNFAARVQNTQAAVTAPPPRPATPVAPSHTSTTTTTTSRPATPVSPSRGFSGGGGFSGGRAPG